MPRGVEADHGPLSEGVAPPIPASPRVPRRTCVGCRSQHAQAELLRFRRRRDGHVVAALGRREAAGRGAWLCPRASCFVAAERQRAFARAYATGRRPDGKPSPAEVHFDPLAAWTEVSARLTRELELLDRCSPALHDHPRRRALARLATELTSQPPPPERSSAPSRKGNTRKGQEGGSLTHG